LKSGLDELYVAVSLGNRASILAHLQQIVPQFTYEGSDQAGSIENVPLRPSAADARHEVPTLVDMPVMLYGTWPAKSLLGPPAGGSPGD
jgi:hypothetical protein